jgi:threonine-phosphate decarboxylase
MHGGDLDIISRRYNIPKSELINFSGNVNPLGLPDEVKSAIIQNIDAVCDYPDVSYLKLREAIAEYTSTDADNVIVGNGSTELISGYIKTLAPKKSIIISPAYSEYLREIELTGSEAVLFPLLEEEDFVLNLDRLKAQITDSVDLVVLCNPNNPTGSCVATDKLRELLATLKAHDAYLMIDETYIEFADDISRFSAMPLTKEYDNLFVIRGTSKFFSCPGLRLGYSACGNKTLREKVLGDKDPWSVNSYAELAGCVMFTAKEFASRTRSLIISERNRIRTELLSLKNIKLYATQSNFFLFKLTREDITSSDIFEKLVRKKLLVRDCSSFPYLDSHYIRFCIQLPQQNDLLLTELKNIIES